MFVHEAPFLGAVNGAAKLRHEAVRLQCYAEVNPGSQPDVLAFWEAQKALADVDHGLPYDGTWVPGALDLRPSCYKVLSHYRLFNTAGLADYKAFCQFFIEKNGGAPEVPLSFSKNLSGSNASDADATFVKAGSAYTNSVEVTGGKPPYTYQWFKRSGGADGKVGADSNTYTIPVYAAGNNGDYFVQVTDSTGKMIESTRDRTRVAISLSTNLASAATWTEGTAATLKVVAANGLEPYTYAWYKDGVATGNTGASLNKSSPTAADAGVYHCVAISSNNRAPKTVMSTKCTVTVNPATPPVGPGV